MIATLSIQTTSNVQFTLTSAQIEAYASRMALDEWYFDADARKLELQASREYLETRKIYWTDGLTRLADAGEFDAGMVAALDATYPESKRQDRPEKQPAVCEAQTDELVIHFITGSTLKVKVLPVTATRFAVVVKTPCQTEAITCVIVEQNDQGGWAVHCPELTENNRSVCSNEAEVLSWIEVAALRVQFEAVKH